MGNKSWTFLLGAAALALLPVCRANEFVKWPFAKTAVLDFQNCERDGQPVLIPAVREYAAAEGTFALPKQLAVTLPAGEELILEQLNKDLKRFGVTAAAGENAVCRFVVTKEGVPEHDDGYTLTVAGDGITVSSRTTAGVFYGAQTLRNLIRNAATPELKCCKITDWPDFERRGYTFNLRRLPAKEFSTVLATLDAMAELKMNMVFISMEECFPYENNPFTKRTNAFTKEQVLELVDFCRKRHIEIIPSLQVLSHTEWMMAHPDWDKMKEGKPRHSWVSLCCPQNEQARELTKKALEEHIKLYRPKVFYIFYDEIYLCPFQECPRCKNADGKKLLADYLEFVDGILRKHGVTLMACHDSFSSKSKSWKYGEWYRTQLKPDHMIRWWSYRDKLPEEQIVHFKDFYLVGNAVCGKPLNVWNMAKLIKKYGGSACNMTYWYYSHGGLFAKFPKETPDSLGGIVNGADYMWYLRDTPYPALGYDGTYEMMRRLAPETTVEVPRTLNASAVPLEGSVNAELSTTGKFPRFASDEALKELQSALDRLPERFKLVTSPGGKYYAARVTGGGLGRLCVKFPFHDRKAEYISFLLTASRPINGGDYHGYHYGKRRFDYDPAAKLLIEYADGEKLCRELGYRKEITDWNRPFGGFGMRFAVRGLDADDNYYSFGIYDFKNPRPDQAIKNISFITLKLDGISPALLAVSARGVDKPFKTPKKPFDPAVLAKRSGVKDSKVLFTPHIVADFEHGMGKVEVSAPKTVKAAMKVEIVDDPTSPSKNKVLKITVPPGKYFGRERDEGLLRISVDMPYKATKKTKSFCFDHKVVASGDDFHHCNSYLLDSSLDDPNRRYVTTPILAGTIAPKGAPRGSGEWRSELFRPNPRHNALKKFEKIKIRRISYFFNKIDRPVEICVDNIGDTTDNVSIVPLWKDGGEAEPI